MFELNLLGSGVFTTAGRLVEGFEDISGEKDGRRGNSAPVNGYNRLHGVP